MAKKEPVAQDAYNELAEEYAARIDTKPHNAYYERPATISLMPDVNEKHVLDVGCGPGFYAEWLVKHGAHVIAFDANPKMVKLARQRLGESAEVVQANLENPLDFLEDASFDMVVAPLVLDYVEDWEAAFREFHRVLTAGGCLVFSMEHPYIKFFAFRETSNYHEVELVKYTWRGFGKPVIVPSYRRPLSAVVNPLLRVGFILDQILEPLPTAEFKEKAPQDYEELMHSPGFMCVRALKG
jgi:ubiquinone/menaquinone biosynthesis C-methylase UbiE